MRKKIVTGLVVAWLLVLGIQYYMFIPAINIHSYGFWNYLLWFIIVPLFVLLTVLKHTSPINVEGGKVKVNRLTINHKSPASIVFLIGIFIVAVMIIMPIYGAPALHARTYAGILNIEECDFSDDIDESVALSKVALMDTESARKLGDRVIGSLTDVVSQFDVSGSYIQIDYQGSPLKVSALQYTGFFKYLANKSTGIPGYVTVDPVGQSTKYVKLDEGMKYVPSAYFQQNVSRHIRFAYPTAIFAYPHFEVDEEGNPYYVAPVYTYKIGLFSGETVKGVIICDPITGDTEYYDVKDIPNWVDKAFDGDLLVKQFDWYGMYNNGFLNSIFAKKGCRKSTETTGYNSDSDEYDTVADYGYISKDGDIWIYTGVTSINGDSSNIGFIMVNERTGEAHYFAIAGADENSAMKAAQGEVQEKRYEASFPSLINVKGEATYIMLLKDANDIVKMYAMVNVAQYNLVTTGETLAECYDSYCKLCGISDEGRDTEGEPEDTEEPESNTIKEFSFEITKIEDVVIDGNSYRYLFDGEGNLFKQAIKDNELLLCLEVGHYITLKADCGEITDEPRVYDIVEIVDHFDHVYEEYITEDN